VVINVIILMVIGGYSIGGYWCLFMLLYEWLLVDIGVYSCYYINDYCWLFHNKPLVVILLMVILLMVINGYYIINYCWLLYVILQLLVIIVL